MSNNKQARTWAHSRKGRITGVITWNNDEWTTIRCTEPNPQADIGEELTFRNAHATEITK